MRTHYGAHFLKNSFRLDISQIMQILPKTQKNSGNKLLEDCEGPLT